MCCLKAFSQSAPMAPSTTRWSHDRVTVITVVWRGLPSEPSTNCACAYSRAATGVRRWQRPTKTCRQTSCTPGTGSAHTCRLAYGLAARRVPWQVLARPTHTRRGCTTARLACLEGKGRVYQMDSRAQPAPQQRQGQPHVYAAALSFRTARKILKNRWARAHMRPGTNGCIYALYHQDQARACTTPPSFQSLPLPGSRPGAG